MADKQRYVNALQKANAAGDYAAANEIAEYLDRNYPEDMTLGEKAKGTAGMLGQMATGAISEPIAGLAGLAGSVLPGETGQGADWITNVQEAMTPTPGAETQRVGQAISEYIPDVAGYIGNKVLEATGNPELATLAHSAPEAIMQRLGLKSPQTAANLAKRGQRLTDIEVETLVRELEEFQSGTSTTGGVSEVAETLQRSPDQVAELAQFDEKVLKAASDLGFNELPPSVAAGNAQFRDIAQGLASMPGTQAKAQYGQFLESLGNKADEIITQGGGDLDKAAVSQRFSELTTNMLEELHVGEKGFYDEIELKINKATPVTPTSTHSLADDLIKEYQGNISKMPKPYKDIFDMVYKKGAKGVVHPDKRVVGGVSYIKRNPSYAEFNQKRKDIGAAIGRKGSSYSDTESGILKRIYGNLKTDQNSFSEAFNASELQSAADALTVKRKALENTTTELLGRKLNKDLMPEVATRIAGLPKGNVKKFNDLVDGIPESIRGEVVVSALNDLFKGSGADQKSFGTARFLGMMRELETSPTAKAALYKHLPENTQKSLDNFYTLANATYKANKENITTGKISTFFPDQRGFLTKMMGKAAATMAASKAGMAGVQATDAIGDFLRNQTPSANKANDFISSSHFQNMMKEAVRDGVHEGAALSAKTKKIEDVTKRSDRYKKWADTLDGNQKADLASLGLVNYLMQADEVTEEENPQTP